MFATAAGKSLLLPELFKVGMVPHILSVRRNIAVENNSCPLYMNSISDKFPILCDEKLQTEWVGYNPNLRGKGKSKGGKVYLSRLHVLFHWAHSPFNHHICPTSEIIGYSFDPMDLLLLEASDLGK